MPAVKQSISPVTREAVAQLPVQDQKTLMEEVEAALSQTQTHPSSPDFLFSFFKPVKRVSQSP